MSSKTTMKLHVAPSRLARFAGAGAFALSLALATGLAGLNAPAARADDEQGAYEIRICNNSSVDAVTAVVSVPPGEDRFLSKGWFEIESGDCKTVATTFNRTSYVYAEGTNGAQGDWAGDYGQGVENPGPFSFWMPDGDDCEDGQDVRKFTPIVATTDSGTLQWDLED